MRFSLLLIPLMLFLAGCADPSKPYLNVEITSSVQPATVNEAYQQRNAAVAPMRLICIDPIRLTTTTASLRRQQIAGIRNVSAGNDRDKIARGCAARYLPSGYQVIHSRWLETSDHWWVLAQTVRYPAGSIWVTVDPSQARYGRRPIEFLAF